MQWIQVNTSFNCKEKAREERGRKEGNQKERTYIIPKIIDI